MRISKSVHWLAVALLAAAPLTMVHAQSVPQLVNYQGTLTDANGAPLATGDYTLKLEIFRAPTGGTAAWTQDFSATPVVKGYFNVILGNNVASAFNEPNAYLQVTVVSGPGVTTPRIILPRQQVLSAPYAISALSAGPIGTITASMLSPSDYAAEVGDPAVFDPKISKWAAAESVGVTGSRYHTLTGASETPDLRGIFLRGLNTFESARADGKGDPDGARVAGSFQDDEIRSHNHSRPFGVWDTGGDPKFTSWVASAVNLGYGHTGTPPTGSTGGPETRPKNVAVYYYIRIN